MRLPRRRIWLSAIILLPGSIALGLQHWPRAAVSERAQGPTPLALESAAGMIHLPAGTFMMGNPLTADLPTNLANARPLHRVRLAPFWLDKNPVTNRQFERFVQQTGYVTEAERRGQSLVFDRASGTWNEVPGVSWRHPESPNSSLVGREQHPVVQVSWQDAAAYAAWVGKRLPTEAEFEYAARGGLSDATYPWGRRPFGQATPPSDKQLANGWQGPFPQQDLGLDGFRGTAPVGQFPPNRFGLYDMAGNVWNWCSDWYAAGYYGTSPTDQPPGPPNGTQRTRRGGSWLSAPHYGDGLRVAYRGHAPPSESTNHTGFRCARSEKPPAVKLP